MHKHIKDQIESAGGVNQISSNLKQFGVSSHLMNHNATHSSEIYYYDGSVVDARLFLASFFCKHQKNILITGPSGCGKTALVEFIANNQKMFFENRPLENELFFLSINIESIIAGTKYRGEMEEKIIRTLDSVTHYKNIVLFLDEAHMLSYTKSDWGIGLMDIIKTHTHVNNNLRVILATTDTEGELLMEDKAFYRRFRHFVLPKMSRHQKSEALKKHVSALIKFHNSNAKLNYDEIDLDKELFEIINTIDLKTCP